MHDGELSHDEPVFAWVEHAAIEKLLQTHSPRAPLHEQPQGAPSVQVVFDDDEPLQPIPPIARATTRMADLIVSRLAARLRGARLRKRVRRPSSQRRHAPFAVGARHAAA